MSNPTLERLRKAFEHTACRRCDAPILEDERGMGIYYCTSCHKRIAIQMQEDLQNNYGS